MKIHLREITIDKRSQSLDTFPNNVPVIRCLTRLEFQTPVTIFMGENGSGKSTLLEGIASAAGLTAIGSDNGTHKRPDDAIQSLSGDLKLAWNKRVHRGFFMRAEDFFKFFQNLQQLRESFTEDLKRVNREYQSRSDLAISLAKMPAASSIKAIEERYGPRPEANSHGERFLALFQSRFIPGGLYLLDEPEAALSPIS